MADASTVDCNAKEDDDEPGGEMCTRRARISALVPHPTRQRNALPTIPSSSPLPLPFFFAPHFCSASPHDRSPNPAPSFSSDLAKLRSPWNRGAVQGENERIANEVRHRVEVLLRLDDGDGVVPPLQEGSDSEDDDDMPPLLECSETEDEDDSDREFEDDPEMPELLSVSDSDEENESDTDSDDDSDILPLQDVSDSEDEDDSPMNGQFHSARIHNLSGNAGLNRVP
ncbi:hypothetical protein B0H13DRAFT_2300429 [Mycena leptocephala]|nr:hypothetical protein B0H13DRAFT_2300429 [Mycena leptocephala]